MMTSPGAQNGRRTPGAVLGIICTLAVGSTLVTCYLLEKHMCGFSSLTLPIIVRVSVGWGVVPK